MFEYLGVLGGILNQEAYYNQAMGMQQAQNMGLLSQLGQASQSSSVCYGRAEMREAIQPIIKPKEKSMFKEVVGDVKGFVLEHRSVIYFIVAALMIDHFFFKGAFKLRLQGMADKVVTKVEEKIK